MKTTVTALVVLMLTPLASGCASRIMVPPQVELDQFEAIGIIQFSTSSEGELGAYATRRFVEEMRRDQGLVRTLDLGTEARALASVNGDRLDPATIRALGEEHNATAVLLDAGKAIERTAQQLPYIDGFRR